jgi:hypothetical protein
MSDRSGRVPDSEPDAMLEIQMVELARLVQFPETPEITPAVIDAIASGSRRITWSQPGLLRRGIALGVLATILVASAAGAVGIGIGAIQIKFADGTPLPTPVTSIRLRTLGREVSLEQADAAVAWPIIVPHDPVLGEPDAIYLNAIPSGGTVSFVWGPREGIPAAADGISLVVTEFRADIAPEAFEKMVDEGTTVEKVYVNGLPGWWIEGGTHAFFYRDQNGDMVDTSLRLVGSALIWDSGRLAIRVEGAPDLKTAMRVAGSLE